MQPAQLLDLLIAVFAPFITAGHIDQLDATIPTKRALEAVGLPIDGQTVYRRFQLGIATAPPVKTKKSRAWQEISDSLAVALAKVVLRGDLTKQQAMTMLQVSTQNLLLLNGYEPIYDKAQQEVQCT